MLQHIIHQVRERGADTQTEWRGQIAQALAESAAIPQGRNLTEAEMHDLVTRLFALPQHKRTSDGKTIIAVITDDEINKKF